MIYYNAQDNLIGVCVSGSVLLRIEEGSSVFRVLSGSWELVGYL